MALLLAAVVCVQAAVFDQGTFITYLSDRQIAMEGFKILEDGRSSSLISSVDSGETKLSMKTEFYTANGALQSAVLTIIGADNVRLSVEDGAVVYEDGTRLEGDPAEPVYAAENYAWHNLTHIFRAFKQEEGKQSFRILVPTLRIETTLHLTRDAERDVNGEAVVDWSAESDGLRQEFVTDLEGRLLYGRIPAQNVEIVRKGFEFLRESAPAAPARNFQPNRDKYEERDVRIFAAAGVTLGGTLTLPKVAGHSPAVLLISGSGPQDRDWNAAPAVTFSPAMQLADRLAAAGYVVLRYDDRGVGDSTGKQVGATLGNLVSDARQAVEFLKSLPEVDPLNVVVAGHSEGGVIGPMLAASDPTLAGCIIIAGTSRPLDEIIMEQLNAQANDERLPESLRDQAARMIPQMSELIARAKAGETGVSDGFGLGWLREHIEHDPRETMKRLRKPVLIVQGLDDLRVLSRNAEELKAVAEKAGVDVTTEYIAGATHFFTYFPYGNAEFDSADPTRMTPKLWEAMIAWLDRKVK
ncbi:MAG: alpha/beta fold hydrolase [Armatimonadetes bacterium]|nr:alpha/beta fold hydrolase [Armatimonadota bacterium]